METTVCYIQTLALLSPYRSRGLATCLLNQIIHTLCKSEGFRELGVTSVYAHVWTENKEALEWYRRRGFGVSESVVEGYYRRLRPGGAWIVWRDLGVGDFLGAGVGVEEAGVEGMGVEGVGVED